MCFAHPVRDRYEFGPGTQLSVSKNAAANGVYKLKRHWVEWFQDRLLGNPPVFSLPGGLMKRTGNDHLQWSHKASGCTSLQPRNSACGSRPCTRKYFPYRPQAQSSSPTMVARSSLSNTCPG